MVGTAASLPEKRGTRPWQSLLGSALAVITLLALAEVFLRWFPPRDLHPYLGEESPLVGLYAPDQDFGITYRSWDAFLTDADRVETLHVRQSVEEQDAVDQFVRILHLANGLVIFVLAELRHTPVL